MDKEKNMHFSSIIDVDKWDKAIWKGTVFMTDFKSPPYIGLAFENKIAGINIFKEWINRLGIKDKYEEIRVSIIEGEIEGQDSGYSVHINSSLDNTIRKLEDSGINPEETLFMTIGRYNRMNPESKSKNLEMFKEELEKYKCYRIFPAYITQKGIEPFLDYAIEKSEIIFRNSSEIKEDDIDYVVFNKNVSFY